MTAAAGPGWYPDPGDDSRVTDRYWDGAEWTTATRATEFVDEPTMAHPVVARGPEQVLVQVGEISCTATTVMTPNGSFPISGTEWIIHDGTTMTRRIPAYAIVLAVVFALLCLIGLLFLLIQEDVYSGSVNVTVRDRAGNYFATSVPVRGPGVVPEVHSRVNYCRYLAAL